MPTNQLSDNILDGCKEYLCNVKKNVNKCKNDDIVGKNNQS